MKLSAADQVMLDKFLTHEGAFDESFVQDKDKNLQLAKAFETFCKFCNERGQKKLEKTQLQNVVQLMKQSVDVHPEVTVQFWSALNYNIGFLFQIHPLVEDIMLQTIRPKQDKT